MNFKIVTWNLRSIYIGDGINGFIHRAGLICHKILKELPDVISFQEIIEETFPVMQRMLPEYLFVGHFRGANYGGEGVFTAIRKDSIEVLGSEVIWLSPTPYVPGSRFKSQSICPRICLMTQLRHKKTGKVFRVFNLHLDHESEDARVAGIQCVLKFVDEYNNKAEYPLFLMGDFNATPDSNAVRMCSEYRDISDLTGHIENTRHDFGTAKIKIDYIFVSDVLKDSVTRTVVWDDVIEGIYLSDHYPICTELEI